MIYPLWSIRKNLRMKTTVQMLCEVLTRKRDKNLGLEVIVD